ncbi:S8 family peptidase, partial [Armatimonas sp.]|uniref:S8 family peptidase n=1 Tax=Armatimonas sp. TaxID=1872638 RepID=UPI00286D5DC5
ASPSRKGWSAVIVKTEGVPTAAQEAAIAALGGDIYRHLPIINSLAVRIPNRRLKELAALPFVSRLSSDMEVKKTDEFTVGHSGADQAWSYGLTGKGIGVAVLDSGVSPWHPDLSEGYASRVTNGVDLVQDGSKSGDPCGHGTHVAGIMAGNGLFSTGSYAYRAFKGIAPTVKVVSVRVLNAEGRGSVSSTIAGIQWTLDNRVAQGIRVLNLSLGHEVGESYKSDPLCLAVEKAWKSGLVVVCAAGNGGRLYGAPATGRNNEGYGTRYGSIQSPANSPYVITVGAVKNTSANLRLLDPVATYSGRGPSRLDLVMKPDIVAPGNRVISLNGDLGSNFLSRNYSATNALPWFEYLKGNTSGNASMMYFYLSGTSMAAPVVSGAAALLLQQDPKLTPDAIKARLMLSADKLGSDPTAYGAGLLNIPAALNNRAQPTVYARSPVLSLNSSRTRVRVDVSKAIWGISVNGTQAIWGEQAIWGTQAIWGEQAIWGSTNPYLSMGSFMIADPVWTDQAIWGSTTDAVDLTSTAILGEK